jgi:hypothetical protein
MKQVVQGVLMGGVSLATDVVLEETEEDGVHPHAVTQLSALGLSGGMQQVAARGYPWCSSWPLGSSGLEANKSPPGHCSPSQLTVYL